MKVNIKLAKFFLEMYIKSIDGFSFSYFSWKIFSSLDLFQTCYDHFHSENLEANENWEEESVLFQTSFNNVNINILEDSIEEQATDVIVNPTNPNMTNKSGVANSIISKAGKEVFQ